MSFNNEVINKKKLQKLMYLTFHNYGIIKSSLIADKVKNLTFHYATMSGISLSVEDLRVPYRKQSLIGLTTNEVDITEENYSIGNITVVERFQKIIDIWNNANNILKDEVLTYFRESDPLNPLYIMAFSGARGNISQVRQLVGMRGLMADPQGQIIDLPIKSNFREGLKVTEYIISSYGARKGLVDTALRTADSGYLTRRLVDVAQDIIIREENCLTNESLSLIDLFEKYKTELTLEDRLIGRLLANPLNIKAENIIVPADTPIDKHLINKILNYKLNDVTVRSPLTCNALRSVCRNCYGWHLSYSKLIDLGEAVGILAAQSIGEPGTQLTMRTFHTGGVFSGDLTKQIRSPFTGTLKYSLKGNTSITRTIHGEKGFNLMEDVKLYIEDKTKTVCSLDIPRGAMLLANNNQKIYCNQVVAEIKKEANLILEEDKRDIYTGVSGEVFFQNLRLEESADGQGATKIISKTSGLIWVLYGDRYTLNSSSKLEIKIGQKFSKSETLASQRIVNSYPGIVNFDNLTTHQEINIINSAMIIENGIFSKSKNHFQLVSQKTEKIFEFNIKQNELLTHGQTIACLQEDSYKTETGGIIYYSTSYQGGKKKRNAKKVFTGFLYWVPEETHQLNSASIEKIKKKNGDFVTKGTTLAPDISSKIDGFIEIDEQNKELIVKPGELYQLNTNLTNPIDNFNRFVEPGELLFPNLIIQKLSYLEFKTFQGLEYVLIRPVVTYKIPQEKGFYLKYRFFPNINNKSIAFRTVKRIFYKDGERVKSSKSVDLVKTFLVLDIRKKYVNLNAINAKIEFIQPSNFDLEDDQYKIKLTLYERIKINDFALKNQNLTEKILLKRVVHNNYYVTANTTIAKIKLLANFSGTLAAVSNANNTEVLILNNDYIKKCIIDQNQETLNVKKGDLVRTGTLNIDSSF
jgi:DNA-directed RNA polymerase subunit beta'